MGLNISKGNMYSWVTHTWNTIKGECPHGCTYCYMKRWGKQKPVRFDESELKTDLGNGNTIFVGSSCDMFTEYMPERWIEETLIHCSKFNNTYLFQSKNPKRFHYFNEFPEKSLFCTTIETNRWYKDIMKDAPPPVQRMMNMNMLKNQFHCYVTIEPIMDFDLSDMVRYIRECNPVQVNIGADSGNNNLPEPSKEKLLDLIAALKEFTVIDQKRNLIRVLKGGE
jgi:DNA repair photolyase